MKKFSLALALLATGATGAVAQTVEDPGVAATFKNWEGRAAIYDVAVMSDEAKAILFNNSDVTVNQLESSFGGFWDESNDIKNVQPYSGDDESIKNAFGVDGGSVNSFEINNWGWKGGFYINQASQIDVSHINADTRVHISIKRLTDTPYPSINFWFFRSNRGDWGNMPRISVDGGKGSATSYANAGVLEKDKWLTIDMSLAELEAFLKTTDENATIDYSIFTNSWSGLLLDMTCINSWEGQGAVIAVDAVYFYTPVDKKPEPVYVGQLKDDATIEATFANWTGKKAIYDVMMIGDVAQSKLEANEDVTKKQWQTYVSASGNLWRKYENPDGDDAMKLECSEDYENKLLTAWPTHLFQIDEWANYGDGHIDFKQDEWGVDLKHFNKDTRFHFALRLYRNGQPVPQPINFYLFRQDENDINTPRFSLMEENVARTNGNHADAPNPIITGVRNGDWMAVDVSLGELDDALKQMTNGEQYVDYSRFDNAEYKGNVYNIHIPLDNTNPKVNNHLAIDGIYFYTPQDKDPNGLENVSDESNVEVSVAGRQISVAGGEGIEVYNPAGMLVARTEGTIVNVADAAAGVYVVKAAGKTVKVVLK